jgi:hypothetical protein
MTAVEFLISKTSKHCFNKQEIEQALQMEKEQQGYSETEVLQLLLRLQQTESYNNLYEWFEQNKKK